MRWHTTNPPNMKKTTLLIIAILTISLSESMMAQQITINNVAPNELEIEGFNLKTKTEVNITGSAGVFIDDWQKMVFYGWILDSETREVVWHMFDVMKKRGNYVDEGLFDFKETISLGPGNYELIYAGMRDNNSNNGWDIDSFDEFMNQLFRSRRSSRYSDRYENELGIRVSASALTRVDPQDLIEEKTKDAIVSIHRAGHNESVKEKFTLTDETSLKIYAIGEGSKDEVYDYVWIYDAEKHKKVWQMEYSNTNFAGGAKKNYVADKTITLPAGSYIVSYSSDDSHSFRKWNSLPPNDPQFWGVTIWASSAKDKANVVAFKENNLTKPMAELIRMGDNKYESQGIRLNSDAKVRVVCYGERGSDEFVDTGWIMDAATREIIWELDRSNSEYAGGASKNRMADEIISLDKGEYIIYYATDDSHSYRDWNASKPYDQERWGITLWATEKNVKFELFEEKEYKSDKVLVEILRVRDREHLSESFSLKGDTRLRIKAIGEGDDGDMHDYGWIENSETGRVVWEMTYRNSDYAGGASKNRMYNDVIILPKGEYKVFYETDGSHSYRDWNASPPRDQESYGISLLYEK